MRICRSNGWEQFEEATLGKGDVKITRASHFFSMLLLPCNGICRVSDLQTLGGRVRRLRLPRHPYSAAVAAAATFAVQPGTAAKRDPSRSEASTVAGDARAVISHAVPSCRRWCRCYRGGVRRRKVDATPKPASEAEGPGHPHLEV